VLIRIEDLKRSIEVLNSLGFDLQYKLSKIRRFTDKEIKFLHKEDGSLLELHTRLFNNPHLLPIDKLDFSEAEYININDNALPVLPEAINFLYLLMHALAHNFSRFIWLWDVYFFKIQMNTKHWQEAELLSKSLGLNQWFNQAEKMNGDNLLRWQTQEHYQGIKRAQYLLTLSSQFKYRFHEILLILLSPYRRWRKK
jgi:hypothetical protein